MRPFRLKPKSKNMRLVSFHPIKTGSKDGDYRDFVRWCQAEATMVEESNAATTQMSEEISEFSKSLGEFKFAETETIEEHDESVAA
ncbi:hypothetical protein [Ahrensia marina]|uniref:Uncharacterized protein n=1 Tax=Ahrensia marina TaxID=1514904 RepID=A0A0N0E8P9_9HYPH|nr:hypothetical protein [Ahrensia marina]KPB02605.1 hypothetical protein SU32_02330 [Ahrensia marina]